MYLKSQTDENELDLPRAARSFILDDLSMSTGANSALFRVPAHQMCTLPTLGGEPSSHLAASHSNTRLITTYRTHQRQVGDVLYMRTSRQKYIPHPRACNLNVQEKRKAPKVGIDPRWSALQQTDGRLIVSGSLKLVICEASAVLRAWGKGRGGLNPKPGAVLSLGESESRGLKIKKT